MTPANWVEQVRFGPDGLVPVIAQEQLSGDVLMLAWANREALEKTAVTGQAHYFSRGRQILWRKGESSGHEQRVREIRLDCDGDAVLYRVGQTGPACHTGARSCFYRAVRREGGRAEKAGGAGEAGEAGGAGETEGDVPVVIEGEDPGGHQLTRLARLIAERARTPVAGSYTAALLGQGSRKISQKVGEEAVEVVVAANAEDDARLASEAADLLYHLLVLLESRGVPLDAVLQELQSRER